MQFEYSIAFAKKLNAERLFDSVVVVVTAGDYIA